MYNKNYPLFLLCESPLHAGSGDDLGIVDLPIQRERHTSFPKIESSSLKGALREAFESASGLNPNSAAAEQHYINIHRFFGYDDGGNNLPKDLNQKVSAYFKDETSFAGSLAFTDARILFFPVKSMKGVFTWITCPLVLNKLISDLKLCGDSELIELIRNIPQNISVYDCLVSSSEVSFKDKVLLEEFSFNAKEDSKLKEFAGEIAALIFPGEGYGYWAKQMKSNLIVLSNDNFADFVNQSTEVITRTKIDNKTGTVQDGALFTEEYLPTDAIMYSLVLASDEYGKRPALAKADEVMSFFESNLPEVFQLGANATIGKGILRTKLLTKN